MSDTDEKTPWTIKGMPAALRRTITERARAMDSSVAEWIAVAVQPQIDRETGIMLGTIEPPSLPATDPAAALGFAEAIRAAVELTRAGAASKALSRQVNALLVERVRAARGLAPIKRRDPPVRKVRAARTKQLETAKGPA